MTIVEVYEAISQLPFSFAVQDLVFNLAPDNIFTAPFRRFRTQVDETQEGKTTYCDSFSLDPNILGLVIVSSALGVAIAKWVWSQKSEKGKHLNFCRVGDKAGPVLSFFSSLATLTSHLMDFTLVYMSPPGLLSLVATQVSSVGQKLTQKLILPFFLKRLSLLSSLPPRWYSWLNLSLL